MSRIEKIKYYGNYVTFGFLFFFIGMDYAIHLSGMYDYFIVGRELHKLYTIFFNQNIVQSDL